MSDRPKYRWKVRDSAFFPEVLLQQHLFGPFYYTLDSRLLIGHGSLHEQLEDAKHRLLEKRENKKVYCRELDEILGVQPLAALKPPCRHSKVEPVYSGLIEKELVALICLNPECSEQLEVTAKQLESS